MENLTDQKYRAHIETLSNDLKLDKSGEIEVYESITKEELNFLKSIKKHNFLGSINFFKANQVKGTCLGLNIPIPNRTNTDKYNREVTKAFITPIQTFECTSLNLDSYINYAKLDSFTQLDDVKFESALDSYLNAQLLTALFISGWNGKTKATDISDPEANPLGEDTHIGWLERIRANAPLKTEKGAKVGEGQTYKSRNALIKACLAKMDNPYRAKGDLVAICGRSIFGEMQTATTAEDLTDKNKAIIAQQTIGGLKAICCPYFPENSLLITSLDNLSVYYYKDAFRRFEENVPAKDRVEYYRTFKVDFIVEDYNAVALFDDIEIIE
ncbi:hypothetical protein A1D22_00725 [Pasteurellaceae bacterium LFhippo2]|nr:hypothetical protein [Pasteurellaceae bacterium LFhippo2]